MQIQPTQPVLVWLKRNQVQIKSYMVQMTEEELCVISTEFMDKEESVAFLSKFFRGTAHISLIAYSSYQFTYTLIIETIHYQPGLLVDTQL